jgi:hypothetical protein
MRAGHDDSCFRTSRSESSIARAKTPFKFSPLPTIADDLATGVVDKPPNQQGSRRREASVQSVVQDALEMGDRGSVEGTASMTTGSRRAEITG